jgi:ElaB/YqjD/DUF883 family membrane-anchored ribosome-binding protein
MATTKQTNSTEKINEALALLNEAARDKKDEFGDLLGDKYVDLKQAVLGMESELEAKTRRSVQKVKAVSHDASEHVKHAASAVDQKVHEDPWKTFGWAVAGAFVVGILLGRKDSSNG